MPFIATPDVAKVRLGFIDSAGNTANNVFHVQDTFGNFDAARMEDLADLIEAWVGTEWVDVASVDWTCNRLEIIDVSTEFGLYLDRGLTSAGLVASHALPSQDTVAISFRSGVVGRSRRGRLYHVGLSELAVHGDYLETAAAADLLNRYNLLRSAIIAEDFQLVVVSFIENNVPRIEGLATIITSIILTDLRVDSMDKRKPNA